MLRFTVNGQTLTRVDKFNPATDSEGYLQARFEFSADWAGTAKVALFRDDITGKAYQATLSNNDVCDVPSEVLAAAARRNYFVVSVYGASASIPRVTTNELRVDLKHSGFGPASTPADPTPDVYEQILAGYGEMQTSFQDTGVDTPVELGLTEGQYIQNNGKISANTSYSTSNPVFVPRGYRVTFKATGYLHYVAMIAKVNDDGTYTPLVNSIDSTERTYVYTAETDLDVVFSLRTENGYSLKLSVDLFNLHRILVADIQRQETEAYEQDYVSLSLFSKFGVVGDSYASGEMYYGGGFHDVYGVSWGQILARKLGTTCVNFSSGGQTTRSWLTAEEGLPLLRATEAQDIYYLALGINDANNGGADYLGAVDDIETGADSFFGNYGKIITAVQEHAPNAKLVLFTTVANTDMKATYNEAIIAIADHFGLPYIAQTDDPFFTSSFYANGMVSSHPVAVVYSGMAEAFNRLLKKCVISNFDYFSDAFMY